MDEIAADMLKRVQLGFRNSQSPNGVIWKALKYRQGQPLVDTKRLLNSITPASTAASASVGTNVVYAKVHNFGHTFNRPARTKEVFFKQSKNGSVGNRFVKAKNSNFSQKVDVKAHSVTIPARPFFPTETLPPAWQAAILKMVEKHLQAST
jgi:phage gpG-like protein